MAKLHKFLCALLILAMSSAQASWQLVREVSDAAEYEAASDLLSYDAVSTSGEFKKSNAKKQQVYISVTGFSPRIRKIYTFDTATNFVSYKEEQQVRAGEKPGAASAAAAAPASPRKKPVQSKEIPADDKPAAGPASSHQKLTVNTDANNEPEKKIAVNTDQNNKPKRNRSFIQRYYRPALVGMGVLGVLWKIRSTIEKRRIEREKSALAA